MEMKDIFGRMRSTEFPGGVISYTVIMTPYARGCRFERVRDDGGNGGHGGEGGQLGLWGVIGGVWECREAERSREDLGGEE